MRTLQAWGPDFSLDIKCKWGRSVKIDATPLEDGTPAYAPLAAPSADDARREQEEARAEEAAAAWASTEVGCWRQLPGSCLLA